MIEKNILPFLEKKIRFLETNIQNTRKGVKNAFKSLWKKPVRGENDGLKENFKMNKDELEFASLISLCLVTQDYETAMGNAKMPYNEFKKIKAFRHAASCQEVLTFASLGFDPSYF